MPIKLIQVQRKLNIGINTIVEFLEKNGHKIDSNPNTRISDEQYALLAKNFREDIPNKESWHSIKWNNENRSLIIALKTKPFIILSGISGTGKSSMWLLLLGLSVQETSNTLQIMSLFL